MSSRPWRFSLRSLLIIVTVLGCLASFFPTIIRWQSWAPQRQRLSKWATGLERSHGKCESLAFQAPSGNWVSVSTAELDMARGNQSAIYRGQPVRAEGFFVIPPGKWVDSLADVVREWDRHAQ